MEVFCFCVNKAPQFYIISLKSINFKLKALFSYKFLLYIFLSSFYGLTPASNQAPLSCSLTPLPVGSWRELEG